MDSDELMLSLSGWLWSGRSRMVGWCLTTAAQVLQPSDGFAVKNERTYMAFPCGQEESSFVALNP